MTVPTNRDPLDPERPASPENLALSSDLPAESAPASARPWSPPEQGDPLWIILGPNGLRAGWSILLFSAIVIILAYVFGTLIASIVSGVFQLQLDGETAASSIVSESEWVMAIAAAIAILSRLEHRRFLDYYLAGPAVATRFVSGLISGFAALSALIAVLASGGWIHFGPAPEYQPQLLRYAALWIVAFFLVALTEEGSFRCYLQFTLARGINFWWALTAVAAMCLWDLTHATSHGAGGVYAMALLGVFPCLYLHLRQTQQNGFWQAAWVGSTLFGFIHTANNGETWIGIFAAAAVGFVFCVSVRLTGSAWWAIGFHAAWDWAETYFYGTADSGFVARGHLFTTTAAGSAFWSGGSDGPEGSVLVLPLILLLWMGLILMYGRNRQPQAKAALAENAAS
jgi:membrane protease YdiL (CAAX protease family)